VRAVVIVIRGIRTASVPPPHRSAAALATPCQHTNTMAPAKKREKDNNADGAAPNGLNGLPHGPPDAGNGNGNGNGHGNAGSTVPPTVEGQIKLNGHQQEQELFLQAFESE